MDWDSDRRVAEGKVEAVSGKQVWGKRLGAPGGTGQPALTKVSLSLQQVLCVDCVCESVRARVLGNTNYTGRKVILDNNFI